MRGKNFQPIHRNYAAIIAMVLSSLCVGVVYIWSAYKATAQNYYSWTPSAANMVASIMLFAFTGGCFVGGVIQDRIGPKKTSAVGSVLFGAGMVLSSAIPSGAPIALFYITYSIIGGLGSGFVYTSALNGIQKWYPDRVGFATGIAAASFGLSTVVFSPLCTMLLDHFAMPVTLRIFGIAAFVVSMTAVLFIRIPDESFRKACLAQAAAQPASRVSLNLQEAMSKKAFWVFFLCLFFYNGTWNMITPLIKDLGIERGLTAGAAVLCLSMTGVTNTIGRVLMSTLSDKIGRFTAMYILCGITAASSLGLAFLGGGGYAAAVLATAFAYGGPSAVFPALCTDLFGPKYSGRNYGFLMMGLGLSSVLFNALSNALAALSGSYLPTFIVGMATAVLTVAMIRFIRKMAGIKARTEAASAAQAGFVREQPAFEGK